MHSPRNDLRGRILDSVDTREGSRREFATW